MSKLTPPDMPPIHHWYDDYRQNPTPRWWIRTQNAFIAWISYVVTYSVARIPIGLLLGSLDHHWDGTLSSKMRLTDTLTYWPFVALWNFLNRHTTVVTWIFAIWFAGYCLTWFCLLTWWLFTSVNDYIRMMLDNR